MIHQYCMQKSGHAAVEKNILFCGKVLHFGIFEESVFRHACISEKHLPRRRDRFKKHFPVIAVQIAGYVIDQRYEFFCPVILHQHSCCSKFGIQCRHAVLPVADDMLRKSVLLTPEQELKASG